jgi:hypothetical protein
MKKTYTAFFSLMCICLASRAQITLTLTDMAIPGDEVIMFTDTTAGIENTPGLAGPNQIWDYSNLINQVSTTYTFMAPASTPYPGHHPTANIAYTTDGNLYFYGNNTASIVEGVGLSGSFLTPSDSIPINPPQTILELPATYGDNFTDTYQINFEGDGSAFGVYKFKYVSHGVINDTIDGWGQLITPSGSYNALREKRLDITTDSIFVKYFADFEPWSLVMNYTNTALYYNWHTNGEKRPIMEMTTDSLGNTATASYSEIPGSFGVEEETGWELNIYPNPTSGSLNIISAINDYSLQVFDLAGKLVISKNHLSENAQVDLADLHNGVYLIKLDNGTYQLTKKVILKK